MTNTGWLGSGIALLLALILTSLPLPDTLAIARPAMVPLALTYLVINSPSRFGLGWAFVLGLLLDISHSTALGQHALSLALLTYLVIKLRATLLLLPAWQQAAALAPAWLAYQGLLLWLDGFVGQSIEPAWRWLPVISTGLCWLPVCALFALVERPQRHGV